MAVTTIQILGYVIAKFFGIKIISELKKEKRFRFFDIAELEKSLFAEGNPTGIKAALSIKGLIANNLRLPLVASSPELSDRIRLLASEAGL